MLKKNNKDNHQLGIYFPSKRRIMEIFFLISNTNDLLDCVSNRSVQKIIAESDMICLTPI